MNTSLLRRVAGFVLLPLYAAASPLEIGPISLTGSGTLSDPDWAGYGGEGLGGLGLVLHASGSNGSDSVTINTWDIEVTANIDGQDFYLPSDLSFDESLNQCFMLFGVSNFVDLCGVNIDGITGVGALSNLGGAQGLVQVYSLNGALLAEAQIVNTQIQLASVAYAPGSSYCPTCPGGSGSFRAQLSVVDAIAQGDPVPEPPVKALCLVGLWGVAVLRHVWIKT